MTIYYDDKEFNDITVFRIYLLKKYLTKHYGEDNAKMLRKKFDCIFCRVLLD